jgi:hypothetical protein
MKGSYCEKYFDSIEDLIEGELEEPITAQITSHVFACSKCRNEYETRRREKEIYAHYLFDIEQPADSWTNFQTRLASEKQKKSGYAAIFAGLSSGITNVFGSLLLSPKLAAGAALLLVCGAVGFVLLKSAPTDKEGDKYVAETISEDSPLLRQSNKVERQPPTILQAKTTDGKNDALKNDEPLVKNQPSKASNYPPADKKSFAAATVKIKQKTVSATVNKKTAKTPQPNRENQLLTLRMKTLENEIAGQIEKVELLLRSFRNVRENEAVEIFDVEYEKRQARKLLETNARLRRESEDYGISYAEELLSRVEPYLLDIANLEANPAPDKVLDIKERVVSQNIIASLQVYGSVAAQ